ncbi:MarR family transcriptional regulator [Flexivirga oryzae]|uniref:DNA-binding MarR family transcriptional regulator n=1 Tax=Flexivirga oryzae TaxID=1794944 RepID=A0A839NFB5_9MICO|nr:MarR family transcriptional regulator [Flexivirga oryzae]MBB2893192.1 DNA-binding MarR family transcriptional regulator [Flexivirga oryzae]
MTADDSAQPASDWPTDLVAMAERQDLAPVQRVAAILHSFDVDRRVVESATSLSAADLRLLWLLSDGRPRTQREISTELNLEQSTVNRQVNAALRAGHLERLDAGSGAAQLTATTDGTRRYEEDVEALMGVMGAALAALGSEQERFLVMLATFVEAYRDAAGGRRR